MKCANILGKGLLVLFLFFVSCSSPHKPWQFEATDTPWDCYNFQRIVYPTQDKSQGLEVEFIHSTSGLHTYVNAFSLPFPYDSQSPPKTRLTLTIKPHNYEVLADRLEGGQRLLLDPETTDLIVSSLLSNKTVHIQMGRYRTELLPDTFPELYAKFGLQ